MLPCRFNLWSCGQATINDLCKVKIAPTKITLSDCQCCYVAVENDLVLGHERYSYHTNSATVAGSGGAGTQSH